MIMLNIIIDGMQLMVNNDTFYRNNQKILMIQGSLTIVFVKFMSYYKAIVIHYKFDCDEEYKYYNPNFIRNIGQIRRINKYIVISRQALIKLLYLTKKSTSPKKIVKTLLSIRKRRRKSPWIEIIPNKLIKTSKSNFKKNV